MVMVTHRDGSSEPFMPVKVMLSMIRTGVPAGYAQTVAQKIGRTARDGITTTEIQAQAIRMLMARNPDWVQKQISAWRPQETNRKEQTG